MLSGPPLLSRSQGGRGGAGLGPRRCTSAGAAPGRPSVVDEDPNAETKKLTFLQILGKSQPVGDSCEPDFFDFRVKQLQWRAGQAQGARGEPGALGAKVQKTGDQLQETLEDALEDEEARKLWMLSPDLEDDLHTAYPRFWARLQPQVTSLLQLVVLLLVVVTYSACPLTVSWSKVVGEDEKGPVKGRPYKDSSVIVVSWLLIAAVGLLLSAAIGGWAHVRQCFDRRAILTFAPAGVGWALADVCEVLAVAKIDPAMYGVISQARLLGSAGACRLILGNRQSKVQWGVLGALSLVCVAYCMVPDPRQPNPAQSLVRWRWEVAQAQLDMRFRLRWRQELEMVDEVGAFEQTFGVLLALGKVTLSVLSGVYGEACFKLASVEGDPPELHVQMTQVSFSAIFAGALGYLALCGIQGDHPREFFSGPDGHWGCSTFVVALVYCWREWICNLCVKRFDSLVKNICNAVALVLTYSYTVVASKEQSFSLVKVMLLLAVVVEVVNYSAARSAAVAAKAVDADEIPVSEYSAISRKNTDATDFELKEA